MNEDEPKWLELIIGKDFSRFVRYSDVISITYIGDRISVSTAALEKLEARELYLCDFFGRRQVKLMR